MSILFKRIFHLFASTQTLQHKQKCPAYPNIKGSTMNSFSFLRVQKEHKHYIGKQFGRIYLAFVPYRRSQYMQRRKSCLQWFLLGFLATSSPTRTNDSYLSATADVLVRNTCIRAQVVLDQIMPQKV